VQDNPDPDSIVEEAAKLSEGRRNPIVEDLTRRTGVGDLVQVRVPVIGNKN
jgi:hypothetical protein